MPDFLVSLNQTLFFAVNNGLKSPVGDVLIGDATWLGDGVVLFPMAVMFLIWCDRASFWRNFLIMLSAVLLGAAVLHGLKYLFQTPRPLLFFEQAIKNGQVVVNVMFQPLHNGSFPSGHTQAAFTVTHTVSWMLRDRGYGLTTRLPIYALACLVGISRMYVGAHFPVDVLGGALIGFLTSHLVLLLFNRRKPSVAAVR